VLENAKTSGLETLVGDQTRNFIKELGDLRTHAKVGSRRACSERVNLRRAVGWSGQERSVGGGGKFMAERINHPVGSSVWALDQR